MPILYASESPECSNWGHVPSLYCAQRNVASCPEQAGLADTGILVSQGDMGEVVPTATRSNMDPIFERANPGAYSY